MLGSQPPLELLLVNGVPVVEQDRLVSLDEDLLAHEVQQASRTLLERA